MDDEKNGEYSRPPELKDVIDLCQALNEQGARYLVVGGIAVILHGLTRGTKDVDLLIDDSQENVRKIKKALSYLPDNAVALVEEDDIQKYIVVRVADEIVVDLMGKACSIPYEEARGDIIHMEIDGVKIPLPSPELLIRMKDTIRPHDKIDVGFLKALIEERDRKK